MNRTELMKLRKAVKSMRTEADTFSIRGEHFSCRWNGNNFVWTPPSGNSITATAREVIQWIADGSGITDHCFSYGE
jgi:hypothetical protein